MKSFDKNKLKKQLVSGGIYIALAAAVVTVTMNGVNNIIGSSDDYELPQEKLSLPNTETNITEGGDFLLELTEPSILGNDTGPENDIANFGNAAVSGTESDINSFIAESTEYSEGVISDNQHQNISDEVIPKSIKDSASDAGGVSDNLISENDIDASGEPEGVEYPTEPDPVSYGFYAKPADGYIDKEYSDDKLIYSTTMGDYRTHNGVDITGDLGSSVKAINAGVIEDIYYDDFYGYTIKINHGDNIIAYYMNLAEALPAGIKKGTKVTMGQIIAGIGNTAAIESAEVSHLHLSITRNGEYIDPRELLMSNY